MDLFRSTNKEINMNNLSSISLQGIQQPNELNTIFFSQENINALQKGLKIMVANATNGEKIIGNQSETDLIIIMRSIYLQYSKNNNNNILEQVRELNRRVLDYTVNDILVEINQYERYLFDASNPPDPLELPINHSNKGSKILYRNQLW
jgi:hypothetical protein